MQSCPSPSQGCAGLFCSIPRMFRVVQPPPRVVQICPPHPRDVQGCPAPSQRCSGLSSSLSGMFRIVHLHPRDAQGCPAPSQVCSGLSSPLLAPLEMPLMTHCCSHHLDDYTYQHLQTKCLLALHGSRREHWAVPHSPWGAATQALTPELQPPALSEEGRTAGSQIFLVYKADGNSRYVSMHATHISMGTLLTHMAVSC